MPRTFTKELYKFDELTPEAQEAAIESYREELYEGKHGSSDFPSLAIDDCALLEPEHKEMAALFGEDYYQKNGDQFVFKNDRDGITFNCEHPYRHLAFSKALEITNREMFLLFLGIPKKFHGLIDYQIYDEAGRYPNTTIEFEIIESLDKISGKNEKELEEHFSIATTKFNAHRDSVLERISNYIDYHYSDESIRETLEEDDSIDFTAEGEIWES